MNALHRLLLALTSGQAVSPEAARGLADEHRAEVRTAELDAAADAIAALPTDYECDPGRGDAVKVLRRRVKSADKNQGYPLALGWARQLDADDLEGFLAELAEAADGVDDLATLAEVENVIATWRALGEAQHAHNTAPGPGTKQDRP
ncbi:hypothetical protein [Streptomyces sp. NPDC057557]|uniref:hypothetical protein n=1 Tax=Streptomyces sp. NPDC057557 TaxID=3346167 RepID=UPI0036916266